MISHPVMYYEQNIGGTLNLLKQMDAAGCRQIVFSSSATVYGEAAEVPSRETSLTGPTNPYGRTKLFIEDIIRDWSVAGDDRSAALLRYFNPIGADESGLIGENPKGIPNNLMPLILEVAIGKREEFRCMAMIMTHRMAPVSVTTFMLMISPADISQRWILSINGRNGGVQPWNRQRYFGSGPHFRF